MKEKHCKITKVENYESDLLNKDISTLNFNTNLYNILRRLGLRKVGDIMQLNLSELTNYACISDYNSKLIEDKIHNLGLIFSDEYADYYDRLKKLPNEQKLKLDIEKLKLPQLICAPLKRAGINKVEDFFDKSIKDIMQIERLGKDRFDELNKTLLKIGIDIESLQKNFIDREEELLNQKRRLEKRRENLEKEIIFLQSKKTKINDQLIKINDELDEIYENEIKEKQKVKKNK